MFFFRFSAFDSLCLKMFGEMDASVPRADVPQVKAMGGMDASVPHADVPQAKNMGGMDAAAVMDELKSTCTVMGKQSKSA